MKNNCTDRSSPVNNQLEQLSVSKHTHTNLERTKLKKVDRVERCCRPTSHDSNARPPLKKEYTFVLERSGKGPSNTAVSIVSQDAPIDSVIRRKSFKDLVSIIEGVLASKAGGKFFLKLEINSGEKNARKLNHVKNRRYFHGVKTRNSCFTTETFQTCHSASVTKLTGFVEHPRPQVEIHLMSGELAENYVLKDGILFSLNGLSKADVKSKNQNHLVLKENSGEALFKTAYPMGRQDDYLLNYCYVKKLEEDLKEIEKHLSTDRDIISKAIKYYKNLNGESITKHEVKDLFEIQLISHLNLIGYHYQTIEKQIINLLKTKDQQIFTDIELIKPSEPFIRSKRIKQIQKIDWKGTKMGLHNEMSGKVAIISGQSILQSTSSFDADENSGIKSSNRSSRNKFIKKSEISYSTFASDRSCNCTTSDTSIVSCVRPVGNAEETDKSKTDLSGKDLSGETTSQGTPKSESSSAQEDDCLHVCRPGASKIIDMKGSRFQKVDVQLKSSKSLIAKLAERDKRAKKGRLYKNFYNPIRKKVRSNFRPIKLYIFNRKNPEQDRIFLKMIKNQPRGDDSYLSDMHRTSTSNTSINRENIKMLDKTNTRATSFNGKTLSKNSIRKHYMPRKWDSINLSDRSLAYEKSFSMTNIRECSDLSKCEWKRQVTTVLERINRNFHLCHNQEKSASRVIGVRSASKCSSLAENCCEPTATRVDMTKSEISCKKEKARAKRECLLM